MIANLMFLNANPLPKPSPRAAVDVKPALQPPRFTDVLQQADKPTPLAKVGPPARTPAESKDKTDEASSKRDKDQKPPAEVKASSEPVTSESSREEVPAEPAVSADSENAQLQLTDVAEAAPVPVVVEASAEGDPQDVPMVETEVKPVDPLVPAVKASTAVAPMPAASKPVEAKSQSRPVQAPMPVQDEAAAPPVAPAPQADDGGDATLQAQTRQTQDDAAEPATTSSRAVAPVKLDAPASTSPPVSGGAPAHPVSPVTASASPAPAQELPPPRLESPQDQAIFARVVRGMQGAINQQGGSVTLRLTPPELGTVRIELAIMQGTVTARFHTETESVRHLLTEQMAQLRAGLERQGLHVERLAVQTQQAMPTYDSQQSSSGGDGRSRGEYAAQHEQRREPQDRQRRQQFEKELLNAVA